jgi:hypothetical protein
MSNNLINQISNSNQSVRRQSVFAYVHLVYLTTLSVAKTISNNEIIGE